jgi:hypothetical protein
LFGLVHNWLAITHFVYIEGLLFFFEEFFWPWAEALLGDYLEELDISLRGIESAGRGLRSRLGRRERLTCGEETLILTTDLNLLTFADCPNELRTFGPQLYGTILQVLHSLNPFQYNQAHGHLDSSRFSF